MAPQIQTPSGFQAPAWGRHARPTGFWIVALVFCAAPLSVHADWFRTDEQRAYEAYRAGDYASAAQSFSDPYRRGVALYRQGAYQEAERTFSLARGGAFDEEARYNLGNARFKLGDYTGAAEAYESVLATNPAHDDAAYNLALTRAMLARLEQEQFREQTQGSADDKRSQNSRQEQQESPPDSRSSTTQRQDHRQQESQPRASTAQQQQVDQEQASERRQASDQKQPSEQQHSTQTSQSQSQQSSQGQQGQPQQSSDGEGQPQGSNTSASKSEQQEGQEGTGRQDGQQSQTGESGGESSDTSTGRVQGDTRGEGTGNQGQTGERDGQTQETTGTHGERGDLVGHGDRDETHDRQTGEDPNETQADRNATGRDRRDAEHDPRAEGKGHPDSATREQRGAGSDTEGEEHGGLEPKQAKPGLDEKARGGEERGEEQSGARPEATAPDPSSQEPGKDEPPRSGHAIRYGGSDVRPPDTLAPSHTESVSQFDQLGLEPGNEHASETREGQMPALDGLGLMGGPGMAVMEERLQQLQGDPSLLIRNQFQLEAMRQLPGATGQWRETRPW